MAENEAPERIYLNRFWENFTEHSCQFSYTRGFEDDIAYVRERAYLAAPDAAQKAYPIPNAAGTWGISLGGSRRLPFSDYWTESAARAACDAINTIVRQGQREAWEAAARLVDMQEPPDYEHGASENGWNDAITHCAAALRGREEGDRDE